LEPKFERHALVHQSSTGFTDRFHWQNQFLGRVMVTVDVAAFSVTMVSPLVSVVTEAEVALIVVSRCGESGIKIVKQ
jgi:hypothetical protein